MTLVGDLKPPSRPAAPDNMAASAEVLTEQIVTLNATVVEQSALIRSMQHSLGAAQQRIVQLEQVPPAVVVADDKHKRRIADPKLLMPDAFVKDEDFRDWGEEFLDIVEAYNGGLAPVMRKVAYRDAQVENSELSHIAAVDVKEVFGFLR